MTSGKQKSPRQEANRLSMMLRHVLGEDRFPVDVEALAREVSRNNADPIGKIVGGELPGFEGMLRPHRKRPEWHIVYNDDPRYRGRVRFTIAHEFGHYQLHRPVLSDRDYKSGTLQRDCDFQCKPLLPNAWQEAERQREEEADTFASYLLMPLDDYREQVNGEEMTVDLLNHITDRYGVSATMLAKELRREGFRSKQGTLIDKGYLYRVLRNRVYRGEAVHKGKAYPGEHEAIVTDKVWDQVDAILQGNRHARSSNSRMQTPAPLKGLIFTDTGAAMTPTATKKRGKLYRYYVSMDVIKNRTTEDDSGGDQAPVRLPAGMVEDAIVTEVRRILQTPEVVTQVLAALKRDQVSEAEAIAALHDFNTLWAQLFPLEQARIIQLLVRRVTVTAAGLEVDIRREGVAGVIREMIAPRDMEAAE